jgi:hypothetical protein
LPILSGRALIPVNAAVGAAVIGAEAPDGPAAAPTGRYGDFPTDHRSPPRRDSSKR